MSELFDEIKRLRDKGDVMGAYRLAVERLNRYPENVQIHSQVAWSLYFVIKNIAAQGDREAFLLHLREYAVLCESNTVDDGATNALIWPVRSVVAGVDSFGSEFLDRLFGILLQIPFSPQCAHFSVLLGAFLKHKWWGGLKQFIQWWNLDNIKAEDCVPYEIKKGRKLMSVAERAYIAYAKILTDEAEEGFVDKEHIVAFIAKLSDLYQQHSEFVYLPYYIAKLYLVVGEKHMAAEALMPFVKLKKREYWVWELLGDTLDDPDAKLSCYCRALLHNVNPQFLYNIHLKLCDLLLVKHCYNEAATEWALAYQVCQQNGWRMPASYSSYAAQPWYLEATPLSDPKGFYKRNLGFVNSILYQYNPQVPVVVYLVEKEKRMLRFITAEGRGGYCSDTMFSDNSEVEVGQLFLLRMVCIHGKRRVVDVEPICDESLYEGILHKTVVGELHTHPNGFGFVEDVYIPRGCLDGFENARKVKCRAFLSYNAKKQNVGWMAVRLQYAD